MGKGGEYGYGNDGADDVDLLREQSRGQELYGCIEAGINRHADQSDHSGSGAGVDGKTPTISLR